MLNQLPPFDNFPFFQNLQEINLRGCGLKKTPVMDLASLEPLCSTLTKLDLSCNAIGSVSSFEILSGIRHLNLQNNSISSISPQALRLPNLQTLILSNNPRIRIFGKEYFGNLPKLTELDLSSTGLAYLDPSIVIECGNTLKTLNLESNEISHLPSNISQMISLTNLNLSNNANLKMISSSRSYSSASSDSTLALPTSLVSLYIQGTKIGPDMFMGFFYLPKLERLYLGNNRIFSLEPSNLLSNWQNLKELSLRNNSLIRIPSEISMLINLEVS